MEADVIIDFASAKAEDALLDYCAKTGMPVVVCTTGLSPEQVEKVSAVSYTHLDVYKRQVLNSLFEINVVFFLR